MKRIERRHLKENELQSLTRRASEAVETRRREMMALLIVIVVIGGGVLGYAAWRGRAAGRAHEMLAAALAVNETRVGAPAAPGTPGAGPSFATERQRSEAALGKFEAVANAYPGTDGGIYARYQQAATLVELGRASEATAVYQQVIANSSAGIYGQMARLGLAEAQARAGQYEQAINAFKELAERKDGPLPVDAVLMQLGRVYRDAGKRADAQQTFNRVVEEFPDSPFNADAKRELDTLKKI